MKKTIILFFVFALLLTATFVQSEELISGGGGGGVIIPIAGTPESTFAGSDLLRTAQFFAGVDIDTCNGYLSFQGITDGQPDKWMNGYFELLKVGAKKYQITYLEVNGSVLTDVDAGDKPRYMFPEYDGIARNYNLGVNCFEKKNTFSSVYGYFYTPVLESGEPIAITLTPSDRNEFVEFSLPEGADPECFYLVGENGVRFTYSLYDSGFNLYINPIEVFNYYIEDTCKVIVHDYNSIDPLAGAPSASGDSALTINLPKGVKEVEFSGGNSYLFLDKQYLEGENGTAQAYFVEFDEKTANIDIYGITDTYVEVYAWQEKGEMQLINISDNNCTYSSMSYCSTIPNGYNRVVVIITGSEVSDNGFSVGFNKWNW